MIWMRDHPRIRGEHSPRAVHTVKPGGSSPHTRGARDRSFEVPDDGGIIPAYAGSTSTAVRIRSQMPDHPRIRGEHKSLSEKLGGLAGSSPHTRGALWHPPISPTVPGIIPAYAGSTVGQAHRAEGPGDHPRIRGEHRMLSDDVTLSGGSSPHTRGARISSSCSTCSSQDHPRIRGEHESVSGARNDDCGSSPHTRGARNLAIPGVPEHRIIPAYAGSTPYPSLREWPDADHPRIRGEHRGRTPLGRNARGSSPHTRGARKSCRI